MNGEYLEVTGEFYEQERRKYEPDVMLTKNQTGYLQKWIEGELKEFRERENERIYEIISIKEEIRSLKIQIKKLKEMILSLTGKTDVFSFLASSEEDIYTLGDGKPIE